MEKITICETCPLDDYIQKKFEIARGTYYHELSMLWQKNKYSGLTRLSREEEQRRSNRGFRYREDFNEMWELRKLCSHHSVCDTEDTELKIIMERFEQLEKEKEELIKVKLEREEKIRKHNELVWRSRQ